jgi:hypothetical protein
MSFVIVCHGDVQVVDDKKQICDDARQAFPLTGTDGLSTPGLPTPGRSILEDLQLQDDWPGGLHKSIMTYTRAGRQRRDPFLARD